MTLKTDFFYKFWPLNENFDNKKQNFDNFFHEKTEQFWPEEPETSVLINFDLQTQILTLKTKILSFFNVKTEKFWPEELEMKIYQNVDLKKPKCWSKIDSFREKKNGLID